MIEFIKRVLTPKQVRKNVKKRYVVVTKELKIKNIKVRHEDR